MRRIVVISALATLVACSGEDTPGEPVVSKLGFSGTTSFGAPVQGATVHFYLLRGTDREHVGETRTDESGSFSLELPIIQEPLLACAQSGTLADPVSKESVALGADEFCTLITDPPNTAQFHINFPAQQAYCLARPKIAEASTDVEQMRAHWAAATAQINNVWGCALEARDLVDADGVLTDGMQFDASGIAALDAAALWQQAVLLSAERGFAPGSRLTGVSLARALCSDLSADGIYDGNGEDGPVSVAGYPLSAQTYGDPVVGWGQSLRKFVDGDDNRTGLDLATVRDQVQCLGIEGPLLPAGVSAGADLDPPHVTLEIPEQGTPVAGLAVQLHVRVSDPLGIARARFLDAAVASELVYGETEQTAVLKGVFDATQAEDGPYTIVAQATDIAGNASELPIELIVNNEIGDVEVLIVPDTDVISSTVSVGCRCEDELVLCELIWPTADLLMSAAAPYFALDTHRLAEGPHTLVCQGSIHGLEPIRAERTVTVDNIASSTYCGTTLLAESDVVVARFSNPTDVLAHATTDSDGRFCITVDALEQHVLLRVGARGSSYTRYVADGDLSTEGSALLAHFHHRPDADVTGMSIDAATSVAAELCHALVELGRETNVAVACDRTHDFINRLLFGALAADVRFVRLAEFDDTAGSATESEKKKLLFHVGLDVYAAVVAVQTGRTARDATWLTLLDAVRTDARDAVLNGFDFQRPTTLGSASLQGRTIADGTALGLLFFFRDQPLAEITAPNPTLFVEESYREWLRELAWFDSEFLFPNSGGGVDVEPPDVQVPATQTPWIRGEHELCVTVFDSSEIVEYAIQTDRGTIENTTIEIIQTLPSGLVEYRICGTLNTQDLDDGPVDASAHAADTNGGRTEVEIPGLQVANDPPRIIQPEPPVVLESRADIEVCAEGPNIENVEIYSIGGGVSPSSVFTLRAPDRGCATIRNYDSTRHPDGFLELWVSAQGNGGLIVDTPVIVITDNADPGIVRGMASLGVPVTHGRVVAYESGVLPRVPIGSGTLSSDGRFELPLPDNYSGRVELVVSGTDARYTSLATAQTVSFSVSDALTTRFQYEPGRPRVVLENVQINALTTLADRLHEAGLDGTFYVSQHVNTRAAPNDRADIRSTRPSNMLGDVASDSDASQRIGLIHAGLARWGAQTALEEGVTFSTLAPHRVLGRLLEDAEDGVLDGRDSAGEVVHATTNDDVELTTNTLRFDLAKAIQNWLNEAPLANSTPDNASGLVAVDFDGPNGFFWTISENDSALFGDAPPAIPFDQAGPTIQAELSPQSPVRGVLTVNATADDPSGVATLTIGIDGTVPAGTVGPDQVSAQNQAIVSIDTTQLANGNTTLLLIATDSVGNRSERRINFTTDNAAPALRLSADRVVSEPTVTLRGTVSDQHSTPSAVTLRVDGGSELDVTHDGTSFVAEVSLPGCESFARIEVTLHDAAGNSVTAETTVACDGTAPVLRVLPTSYCKKQDLQVSYNSANRLLTYECADDGTSMAAAFGASTPPLFDAYASQIQRAFFPPLGGPPARQNPLQFEFQLEDVPAQPGAPSSSSAQTHIEYRYLIDGLERAPWRGVPRSGSTLGGPSPVRNVALAVAVDTLSDDLMFAPSDAMHRIEFRATDSAGNVRVYPVTFRLHVWATPTVLEGCTAGDLSGYSFADLARLYDGAQSPLLRGFKVRTFLPGGTDTFLSWQGRATSSVERLSQVLIGPHNGGTEESVRFLVDNFSVVERQRFVRCAASTSPGNHGLIRRLGGWTCQSGGVPSSETVCDGDCLPSESVHHLAEAAFLDTSGNPLVRDSAGHRLPAGSVALGRIELPRPRWPQFLARWNGQKYRVASQDLDRAWVSFSTTSRADPWNVSMASFWNGEAYADKTKVSTPAISQGLSARAPALNHPQSVVLSSGSGCDAQAHIF